MKKFRKFVLGSLSVASVAAGAYYVYKHFIKKDSDDDLDEFDDDFDDLDEDEEDDKEKVSGKSTTREYVQIQMEEESKEAIEDSEEAKEEDL